MSVILVNYAGEELQSYNFGFLGTPNKLLKPIMLGFKKDEQEEVLKAVQGLSFTNAKQLIRLGIHRGVPKTYKAYTHLRSEMYGSSEGIYTVDVSKGVYTPAADLKMWFDSNRSFMFSSYEDLRPRGVLLHGVGGTGKTEFSKYCSRELQVPLFRLDIASSLSRWQGESEANIRQCLKYVEEHSPCILLIDEVEKALPKSNSEESSTRILGHLLWWLQEHQSNVFSVMTVNDKSLLPPELFRDGRIDAVFELKPLQDYEACAAIAFAWFEDWKVSHEDVPTDVIDEAYEMTKAHFGGEDLSYTPAAIVNLSKHLLRAQLAKLASS
ncbi:MAG: AAA family ATPase [Bacteroidaceae bacterium]